MIILSNLQHSKPQYYSNNSILTSEITVRLTVCKKTDKKTDCSDARTDNTLYTVKTCMC